MQIGTNIKLVRVARNLRQKELASRLGITPTYLSLLENNDKKPSLGLMERISTILNIPLAVLFSEVPLATG